MAILTENQVRVLVCVAKGNEDISEFYVDLRQLIEKLGEQFPSWKPSKQSLQFILRALMKKNLITRMGLRNRRSRDVQTFGLTISGRLVVQDRYMHLV